MTQRLEHTRVRTILEVAEKTADRLQKMSEIVAEYQRQNAGSSSDPTERLLATANSALQRWRLDTGVRESVLVIKEVEDWEDDEFD